MTGLKTSIKTITYLSDIGCLEIQGASLQIKHSPGKPGRFRKLTKTKGAFPNETSLLKLLYVGLLNAQEKWTMPIHNWNLTLSQLSIYFEGRLDHVITL